MIAPLLSLAALATSALASLSYDRDSGKLASIDAYNKKVDDSEVSLKEICYRNLYADVADFQVKHTTETLLSDTSGATVFLSDGLKKDVDDTEFYYEEFCSKQFAAREHDKDVQKSSGILVGRDFGSLLGLDGLSGFSTAGGFGGADGQGDQKNALGGASGLFSKGSFLDDFSKGNAMGDIGLGDGGKKSDGGASEKKKPADDGKKVDGGKDDSGGKGGKEDFGGIGGIGGIGGSFGSSPGGYDSGVKEPVGDNKAYDGAVKGKDDGVKKRSIAAWRE